MLKKQLLKFLTKRLYLFVGGCLYRIEENCFTPVVLDDLKTVLFPVLIVGKEHYREYEKRYPVSNHKDLADILKYQSIKPSLSGTPLVFDEFTLVPHIELDEVANEFISSVSWSFWLPESWVLNLTLNTLYQINRANYQILAMKTSVKKMVSPMAGPFKSKNYFLMSAGVSNEVTEKQVSGAEYASVILEGFKAISRNTWLKLVNAQNYHRKLAVGIDWRALAFGVIGGLVIWQVSYWAYLSTSLKSLDEKISEQKVAEVVALQTKFENSISALRSMQNGGFDKSAVFNIWDVLLTLMENNTNILSVLSVGVSYELYLESVSSTETLELLRSLKVVESANFVSAVRQSIGQEKYRVKIKLVSAFQDERT